MRERWWRVYDLSRPSRESFVKASSRADAIERSTLAGDTWTLPSAVALPDYPHSLCPDCRKLVLTYQYGGSRYCETCETLA